VAGLLPLLALRTASAADPTPAELRASLREMRKETLDELYKAQPSARKAIRGSAGYAVFTQTGVQFLLVGGGGGRGLVRDNLTGKDTFMKMAAGGVGLGLGVKDTRLVFVFKKRDTLKKFVEEGWQFGGEASAVAKAGESGGSAGELEAAPGVVVYQLAKGGLIAQATVQGTRFWKDEELN
jgi:lipid-binding SYLF domain-containing protein